MTKATLFDSFYASFHNETLNYVADCADQPFCPFLKPTNKLITELDIREETEGCAGQFKRFIQRKTVGKKTPEQFNYNWPDRVVFNHFFFFFLKQEQYHNM